jgi:hypothetical protein
VPISWRLAGDINTLETGGDAARWPSSEGGRAVGCGGQSALPFDDGRIKARREEEPVLGISHCHPKGEGEGEGGREGGEGGRRTGREGREGMCPPGASAGRAPWLGRDLRGQLAQGDGHRCCGCSCRQGSRPRCSPPGRISSG